MNLQTIIDNLQAARQAMFDASRIAGIHLAGADGDETTADLIAVLELCGDIDVQVNHVRHVARERKRALLPPATVRQMTTFIVKEIDSKEPAMKNIPGGERAAAKRNADGRCECCGHEWELTYHHIIPRDEGGLEDAENLMLLCKSCHDDIEQTDHRTRDDILRYAKHSIPLKAPGDKPADNGPTPAEKAAETRAAKALAAQKEEQVISEWDQWKGMTTETVQRLYLGEPEPLRPEKPWHVAVYGAGHNASIARER